jgi:hypothetical protein
VRREGSFPGRQGYGIDKQIGPQLQFGMIARELVGFPAVTGALVGGFRASLGMDSGVASGDGGFSGIVNRYDHEERADQGNSGLNFIQTDALLRGFRHANLLAQIGLIVVLWLIATWLAPIRFDRLFPLDRDRAGDRWWSGALLDLRGLRDLFLLLGLAV